MISAPLHRKPPYERRFGSRAVFVGIDVRDLRAKDKDLRRVIDPDKDNKRGGHGSID
jgi:hypothetical protein